MAMSWKAPTSSRQCMFHVTSHATERFRERAEEEFRSYTDRDLAVLLDERVTAAHEAKQVDQVIDSEQPDMNTRVVRFELRNHQNLFAVLRGHRPNGYPPLKTLVGPNGHGLAIVTVLTQEMVTKNFANKRWIAVDDAARVSPREAPVNRPFADKLAGVVPVAPKPAPAAPAPAPAAPAPEEKTHTRGGSRADREAFAAEYIRENPKATNLAVSTVVKAKFGTSMSDKLVNRIREAAIGAKPAPAATAPTPPARSETLSETRSVTKAIELETASATATIATQYDRAIEAENLARDRVHAARLELDAAEAVLANATASVDQLEEQLRSRRRRST